MADDIGMEIMDARNALGFIVLREADDGQVYGEVKSLAIDKLSAAKMLYQMAKHLKALHEAEVAQEPSADRTSAYSGEAER